MYRFNKYKISIWSCPFLATLRIGRRCFLKTFKTSHGEVCFYSLCTGLKDCETLSEREKSIFLGLVKLDYTNL